MKFEGMEINMKFLQKLKNKSFVVWLLLLSFAVTSCGEKSPVSSTDVTVTGSTDSSDGGSTDSGYTGNRSDLQDNFGSKNSNKENDKNILESIGAGKVEVTPSKPEDFDIKEYLYVNDYGTAQYYIVVTNNSMENVSVYAEGTARDSSGSEIGSSPMYIDYLGAGETTIGYFFFSNAADIETVEYEIEYESTIKHHPILNSLQAQYTYNDDNIIIEVNNQGKFVAENVSAYALFFDAQGQVIATDNVFLADGEGEIKVGATATGKLRQFDGYERIEVYFVGRASGKKTTADEAMVSEKDFPCKEYYYESYGTIFYFVAVTNNTDEETAVRVEGVARDASGNSLSAAQGDIEMLGPGESSVCCLYFDNAEGTADIEYHISLNKNEYYDPVLSDLKIKLKDNGGKVNVTVTNKGQKTARYVTGYAFFVDKDGNLMEVGIDYFSNNNLELNPGDTVTKEMECRSEYDHVDFYLTGIAGR